MMHQTLRVAVLVLATSGVAFAQAAHPSASPVTTTTAYDVTAGYGDDDYAANIFTPARSVSMSATLCAGMSAARWSPTSSPSVRRQSWPPWLHI